MLEEKQIENEIAELLMALSFRNNAHDYYKTMLLLLIKENNKLYCITKFYKKIALLFRTTYTKVEHTMRAEIKKITKNKMIYILNEFFGINVIFKRPSISEFINMLMEYLREFKDCKLQIKN